MLLYTNRLSLKNPGIKLNTKDPYVKLNKIILPLADFQSSAFIRSLMAVTSMDFSEDDTFLQLCCQRITSEGVKDVENYSAAEDIFVVWNVANNKMVGDFDQLKSA